MKLLLKEYLMALAERDELDRLLPEILSSVGLHVFSEPRTRGRQHGVDIAAAGRLPEDTQKRRRYVPRLLINTNDLQKTTREYNFRMSR